MTKDNLIDLKKPEPFVDEAITDILRQGACRLISAALEDEIQNFFKQYEEMTEDKGAQRIVRNGYFPKREIQTGIGQVPVTVPRIHDRHPNSQDGRDS